MAKPLSARRAMVTCGQRARSVATRRVRTATTPRLACTVPCRKTAVRSWLVSPSKTSRGVHVLLVVAVIGASLLLSVRRIICAVQIEQQVRGRPAGHPVAFLQVDREECVSQLVAGAAVDGILQTREGRLTGQVSAERVGTPAAHEL